MNIKSIIENHEETLRKQKEALEVARKTAADARKATMEKNIEWVRSTLLPVIQRISSEINAAGFPTEIHERIDTGHGHAYTGEQYFCGIEFRVSKRKGGSPVPNIKYSWKSDSAILYTELRPEIGNPPTTPSEAPMEKVTAADIERDIERFLKSVYNGRP